MADIIMNDVVKAILDRRSIRKYADKQITEEELQTLLTCAFNAPSGGNSQSWFISVVQDKEVLENMNKAFVDGILNGPNADDKARERFGNPEYSVYFHAPTVMFISYPKSGVETNASLLGENIVLAAQSLGLGTCYLGGIIGMLLRKPEGMVHRRAMKIPEDHEVLFGISIGYPEEAPAAKPRDLEKFVRI